MHVYTYTHILMVVSCRHWSLVSSINPPAHEASDLVWAGRVLLTEDAVNMPHLCSSPLIPVNHLHNTPSSIHANAFILFMQMHSFKF